MRELTTCKKIKFINEEFANEFIKKLHATSKTIKLARGYLCSKCMAWHVTSKPDNYQALLEKYRAQIKAQKLHIKQLEDRIVKLKSKIRFQ